MNCKVCGNTSSKSTSVSFFRFPKENKKCRDWAERCDLLSLYEKHGTLRFYKSFRICSAHFDPKDIVYDGRKRRLLQSALPNLISTQKVTDEKRISHSDVFNLKLAENLCRLCAKEYRNLTDIYGWQGRTLNLESKLKYFPLMINRYDGLPLRVCHPCISKVNQFHDFIIHCMKAETQLRMLLDLEVCGTTRDAGESSAAGQETATHYSQTKTPNLESLTGVSDSPELMKHFSENIADDYYGQVLQNDCINDDSGKYLCNRTNFDGQSESHPEPSLVTTIQLTNHTNYNKEVDFSNTISLEHDYSNTTYKDPSPVELESQIDNEQNFVEGTKGPCQICFEPFLRNELPNSHALTHSIQTVGNMELNRENSNKVFSYRMEFEEHTSPSEGINACKICDKKFHKVAFLEEPLLLHASENLCDDFPNLRPSQLFLESDEKMHHKNFCELKLRSPALGKTNLRSRKRRCQFCDKLFKNNQLCLTHEKSHTGETPYQCKQCGKRFRSRPSLRQHRSVHSDKRLYNCQECGTSFKRKDTLSNHFRIHTGERPFVCKVCGFAFKQRGDCMKHEKNHQKASKMELNLEKSLQKSQPGGFITEEIIKADFPEMNDDLSRNNDENSSLPSYILSAEETATLDHLDDVVAGQIICFNF